MASDILKEFLVAIGFRVAEDQYKRQREAIGNVEKDLSKLDKQAKERDAGEKARVAAQAQRAAEVAATLRMVGTAVAGFAVVATGAMAVVVKAVKDGIGEFDRLAYVSGRTGASVNNIKAIGYAFSQTGSSAEAAVQALESFAKARRANPGVDGMLRSYGVSTEGDGSEVLANALDAITKRHPQYTSQQVAALFDISPDDVDHWIRYRKEIAQFEKQYKDLQRTFGVNGGEMARASTSISRAMGEWSAVASVLRDKLVSLFLPTIEAVAERMSSLLKFLTNEENVAAFVSYFDKPIAAIKEMVRWVRALYDQFVLLFDYVRNSPIGKLLGGINPGYFREKLLDLIVPSPASASEGGAPGGEAPGEKPGLIRRGWNAIKRGLGVGGGESGGGGGQFTSPPPSAAGTYRPQRTLTERDLSDAVVNTIAGEARLRSPGGADAVINNMFNRLGSKGWGPSRDLHDVARAPGQYEGYRQATAAEATYIRDRIRAIASGGVPDNTNGANSFRASWYRGPWWRKFGQYGKDVSGNTFAYDPSIPNGPYAPYDKPKTDLQPPRPVGPSRPGPRTTPGGFDVDAYLRAQPMGAGSTTNDNSRSITQNNPVSVTVNGSTDPAATGAAVGRAVGQANDMSLRNVSTAIR